MKLFRNPPVAPLKNNNLKLFAMANVKYFIKNTNNPTTLYVRFSVSRDVFFRKSTQLQINPKFFNAKSGKIKNVENYDGGSLLEATLANLRGNIISAYNSINSEGGSLDSNWFSNVINKFFKRVEDDNLEQLEKYAYHYVEKLPFKANPNGTVGCSTVTIRKYTTILRKITAFEKYTKRKYRVCDVGLDFRNEFIRFLIEEQKLASNTAGRYLKFVKTICLDARRNGHRVHSQLEAVKGYIVKTDKIILSLNEIEMINNTEFNDKQLDIARDWFVAGCFLGQRVSDLLILTSANIVSKNDLRLVELTQQKTKKRVSVLLHPKVESILKKYNGQFPPRLTGTVSSNKIIFNRLIKIVAKDSGITEVVYGGRFNNETKRKVWKDYPKWQLISSHCMRRSFASNFYGDIPTALLISVTGHSAEKEFLNYVGKSSIDYAGQLAHYWKI